VVPRTVRRLIGITTPEAVIRGYGAREIATGVAILMSHDATPWVWGRVAGEGPGRRRRRNRRLPE